MLAKEKEVEVKEAHADIEEKFKFMDESLRMAEFTILDKSPRSDGAGDDDKMNLFDNKKEFRDIRKNLAEALHNPQYEKLDPLKLKALAERLDQKL